MREAGTIWTGSAFDCSSSENEIFMIPHFHYLATCSKGTIVAIIISVEEDNYTSQLNVTVTPETVGKNIECLYTDGTGSISNLNVSSVIDTTGLLPCKLCQPLLITINCISGPLSPPDKLQINNINFLSQELTFSWSPVAPDCPAIRYNILASNCGSCPTTTNYTTVTCINVPTDGSVCTFAVQTVVCGNITGNASDAIRVNTSSLHPTGHLNLYNLVSNTAFIISTSSLATALIISVMASTIVIAVILKKYKTKAVLDLLPVSRAEGSTHMESVYEDVTGPLSSVSAINTQDNVAYGHTQTSTNST